MATGTVLKMKFDTIAGSKTWTFKYAKPSAGLANVKALGAAMIANGSIYAYPPVALTEAREVVTTEQVYDLED